MTTPRVRFAPSPTGYLHIGGARTALFNWLHARRNQGTFILRMEDTDRERSTPQSVQAIIDGLNWLGIDWDEGPLPNDFSKEKGAFGPYFQTARLDTYAKIADQLIGEGKAYRCTCTREEQDAKRKASANPMGYKYDGTCRTKKHGPETKHVVRFRMPDGEGTVSFDDLCCGKITKTYDDLDDWVMLRGDGVPLYNYGCVLDDHFMEITLVARGQEHINSTFPQLMLYQALGWATPQFAHMPLILGPDREKLSKRKHPEADVMAHKANGILPDALINFIARLGWSHGNDEVISREQMIEWFGFDHVGTTSGVWNPEKLAWLNEQWLKKLPEAAIAAELKPFLAAAGFGAVDEARAQLLVKATRERSKSLLAMVDQAKGFFTHGVTFDEKAKTKFLTADAKKHLLVVKEKVEALAKLDPVTCEAWVSEIATPAGVKMGAVAQPIRVAVTGTSVSPPIGETLTLIGRDEVLFRLGEALKLIP